MAHRSNQAVASQDQTPGAPDQPPPHRRLLVGWATALAALGVSTVIVGLGVWFVRMPLAELVLEAALADRGVSADFQVVNLDLNGVTLANVRVGPEQTPDVAIGAVSARWTWVGLSPQLASLRIEQPRLRLRLDATGRVSAGSLDQIERAAPGRRRPRLPTISLDIVDGETLIDAPFGQLHAAFESSGVLGRDFAGLARIAETTQSQGAYALRSGGGELRVISRDETITANLDASAAALGWPHFALAGASLRASARAPLDLESATFDLDWRAEAARVADTHATASSGGVTGEATFHAEALRIANWRLSARGDAQDFSTADARLRGVRAEAHAGSDGQGLRGRAALGAEAFSGMAMMSQRPAAAVRFFRDASGAVSADALVTLAHTSLSPTARQRLRALFPDAEATPIGPTMASAERALDRAASSFVLTVPLALRHTAGRTQLSLLSATEATSATGARMRLSPLRQDAPGIVLTDEPEAPPTLHGAVALELEGGGVPRVSALLDTLAWTQGAPFEADGTLSLSDWSSDGASIAADEVGLTIAFPTEGGGRLDLRGPLRISGPLGDGAVRGLVATLDATASWGASGWRVASNSQCMPIALDSIEAAGLAFHNGAFALCPTETALIAANANGALSGGFNIQRLALAGRMAGPDGQPAQLTASNITGRFSGRPGAVALALSASTPNLAIDMTEDRTLSLGLRRITAEAAFAESWRVEGAFEQGELRDPALPGTVSTIAGSWRAAPQDGEAVIAMAAGEALVTANRPATDAERPLFNPVRLVNMGAELRGGRVRAEGDIVLAEGSRQLARFAAEHDVRAGLGGARITAERIQFDETLQPYDITERTRGMVDNVRGPIAVVADVNWTRTAIQSQGTLRLDGLSLATATIPVLSEVRGAIFFDDLFALTTPPGQFVTVGMLDPGVAVHNGRVRFQLLSDQRVSIEAATFDFASGLVDMRPDTITLGADETRIELRLRDVDAAALLATLKIPDLAATGQVEGEFPLLLNRRSAFIENGVLRARPGGGLISYTGNAGQNATGPARIAFDALRSFRYDNLLLTLDGDLNGEVVSSIAFSGQNSGRAVDLGDIAPIPGVGRVTVRGVPFDFNVRVTAPFRRLAQTAASITDPTTLLNQAREPAPNEPVDPQPPSPR
ncbi:MAG: YdbH domain-containing protein [Hyphomonadaceae bacterium]|nr:YdbH domain-containing protein [Hyphomonadaceae bacterium]